MKLALSSLVFHAFQVFPSPNNQASLCIYVYCSWAATCLKIWKDCIDSLHQKFLLLISGNLKIHILRTWSHSPSISFPYFRIIKLQGKRKFYHLLRNEHLPKWRLWAFIVTERMFCFFRISLSWIFSQANPFTDFLRPSTLLILNHFCLVLTCFLANVFNSPFICMLSFGCACILSPFIIFTQPKPLQRTVLTQMLQHPHISLIP